MMEEYELINEAMKLGPIEISTGQPNRIIGACENFYMNGVADDVSGHVDAPTGHFYRVDRWIVTTNDQGFKSLTTFDKPEEAEVHFDHANEEYMHWDEVDTD